MSEADSSMYTGTVKFDREQLVFMAEVILDGAWDRVDGGLPDDISWEEREVGKLTEYERGGLEAAGYSLAVMYAQLSKFTVRPDGLSAYDALGEADMFHEKLEKFVTTVWADEGKAIQDRRKEFGRGPCNSKVDIYEKVYPGLYPDLRKHAEVFVDNVLKEYLHDVDYYQGHTEVLLHTIQFDVTSFGLELTPQVKKEIQDIVEEVAKENILGEISQGEIPYEPFDDNPAHAKVHWRIV